MKMTTNKAPALLLNKLALSAMLIAAGVILSPILRIPGMCPMQHFINIIAAVFLGPWYALGIAVLISVLRMSLMGINLLALTGSVFGAVLAGLFYQKTRRLWAAWLGEIVGTGILGALCSYPALRLIAGVTVPSWYYYIPWFTGGTLIGGCVAYLLLCALKRAGLLDAFCRQLRAASFRHTLPCVLSIAGSDCSGGAGIQADVKAVSAQGCYAMTAITSITAQNTTGVQTVRHLEPELVTAQLTSVFSDIPPAAVKIGMLGCRETVCAVSQAIERYALKLPVVLDPLILSSSGTQLLDEQGVQAMKQELFPITYLVTPNLPEAEALADMPIHTMDDRKRAAKRILSMGPKYVLIKGGHARENADDLLYDGVRFTVLKGRRLSDLNTHGTGCTLSSAIAANLAKGMPCEQAVRQAKESTRHAIAHSLNLGHGNGPTNPFYHIYKKAGMV